MQDELFEQAPVPKAYFHMSFPVVFGMVVTLVYNMVDMYFISQTGNTSLVAGVALTAPMFTLMIALGDICGLGGSSSISRLFGQKKDQDGKRLSVFCFYAACICGLMVAALMLLFRTPVLHLLGADPDTVSYASSYYTCLACGAPFIIFYFVPLNLLRTEGFAQHAMIGSVLGSAVNIVLDPIFISSLGWGAAGAAAATVIGNVCADVYYVWVILKKSRKLSLHAGGFYIRRREIAGILAIGIPGCVTNVMQSLSIVLTNRFLLPFGNDKVAAFGIAGKVNMIAALILIGLAFGAQPLIGYNYGAGNTKRLRQILRFCYGFECAAALVLCAVLCLAGPFLIRGFLADAGIVKAGTQILYFQQAGMMFAGLILVTTVTCQASGKALGAFILSVCRQGAVFIPVLFLASRVAGFTGVIASQAFSDLLTAGIAAAVYCRQIRPELNKAKAS